MVFPWYRGPRFRRRFLAMAFSFLKRTRDAAAARPHAKPRRRPAARPWLEPLEERLAPATRVWDGGSPLNGNWSTAANWVGDVAPVPGVDDLQFPSTAARKANTNDFVGATFLGIAFTGSNYVLGGNGLTLGGNLRARRSAATNAINLSRTLNADRTFQVDSGSSLTISGTIADAGPASGFTKTGPGVLLLTGANTYSGLTRVTAGQLRAANVSALGSSAGGTTVTGGLLRLVSLAGPVTFNEPLTLSGGGLNNGINDATWAGPITLAPLQQNINADPGTTFRITGPVGGAGGFRHLSTGVLEFAGSAANTFGGSTEFARGTLRLNKPAGVTAIPGALQIGTDGANAGVVTLMAPNQVGDSAAVTIVGGSGFFGTLDLNGFAETIGSLSGTGHVRLGSGALTTGANNTSTAFGGDITGTGSLTKVGSGIFTLTGASTYTGPTAVNAGNLRVNGSITSAVTVNGSGTLSGAGTTGAITANPGGTVSPGTGPGILTAAGSVALGAGSAFVVALDGTVPASGYDQLNVTGSASTVSLGGNLSVLVGFAPAGQSFTIINNGGSSPVSGTFSGLPEGSSVVAGTSTFRISYHGGDGNDVVLTHMGGPPPGDIEWVRQFGSFPPGGPPGTDFARAAAADGNVYVAGDTDGTFPGQTNAGGRDAYVRKYDRSEE